MKDTDLKLNLVLSECAEVSVPDEQVGPKGVDVVDDYNCDILKMKHWYWVKNTHVIISDTAPPKSFPLLSILTPLNLYFQCYWIAKKEKKQTITKGKDEFDHSLFFFQ